MFQNKLKEKLTKNIEEPAYGIFIGFPSTQLIEMAAYNGFDVVVLDNEHGLLSPENMEHMVIASENAGITPLVRVTSSNPTAILKAMDRVAHGVHVPQVDSREEAEQVVAAVKYPPMGNRGAAFSMRAAKYGTVPVPEYLAHANNESLVCIHIESKEAVDNLDEILQVPGIDMVYIGPTDLSVSLGFNGDTEHPEVQKQVKRIYQSAKKYGVRVGMHTKNKQGALQLKESGVEYIGLTVTSLINKGFRTYIEAVK
ncbi:HpcH/HpaI aldolase family protein [Oceanobacillus bengalensis]|uniref:Aldolase n=1 Tax=Oceanobacillus bengalensis TaxID=1435466 RepID=A0A494YTY6_9BACI|nr:aldolase [Oceanobacillus bengalensis]